MQPRIAQKTGRQSASQLPSAQPGETLSRLSSPLLQAKTDEEVRERFGELFRAADDGAGTVLASRSSPVISVSCCVCAECDSEPFLLLRRRNRVDQSPAGELSEWEETPFTMAMLIVARRRPRRPSLPSHRTPPNAPFPPSSAANSPLRLTARTHLFSLPAAPAAALQVLDQFGRHIKRGQPRESLASSDARALRCSEAVVARGWGFRLSVPEHVFALMPMRHTPTLARLDAVLKEARW